MRRLLALTASAVVTASLLGYCPPATRASCVGPSLAVGATADPGQPPSAPALSLTRGDRRWEVGTADATDREQQYAISWTVVVPNDVDVGTATLRAESAVRPVQIS